MMTNTPHQHPVKVDRGNLHPYLIFQQGQLWLTVLGCLMFCIVSRVQHSPGSLDVGCVGVRVIINFIKSVTPRFVFIRLFYRLFHAVVILLFVSILYSIIRGI